MKQGWISVTKSTDSKGRVKKGAHPMIFPRQFSTFLKSGLFSGSSSQQLCINMYTLGTENMSVEEVVVEAAKLTVLTHF